MLYRDLYKIAEALEKPPVTFQFLRKAVNAHHPIVGRVDVISIDYLPPTGQAFYRLSADRSSAYEEEFLVAEIVHCNNLRADIREYRYALTKELMHVFDRQAEVVDTAEKFRTLLKEIQNRPLLTHASPMYVSEIATRWMAVLMLIPKKFRDEHLELYKAKDIADFDLAEIFEVPEWVVPFAMDDYYDIIYKSFVTNGAE
jgi:hypothetical protein